MTRRATPRDLDRLVNAQVRGMRFGAEAIQNQRVQIFQERPTAVGDVADVGAVGDSTDAKPKDLETGPVLERDGYDRLIQDGKRLMSDLMDVDKWGAAPTCVGSSSVKA